MVLTSPGAATSHSSSEHRPGMEELQDEDVSVDPQDSDIVFDREAMQSGVHQQIELSMYNPSTEQLCVVGQDLTEIPIVLGHKYGSKALQLDLSHNQLQSLENLEYFAHLEELCLDNNELGDNIEFPECRFLRTLSLNKNKIENLHRLLDMLRVKCPSMTYLSLIGNKVCPNGLVWASSEDDYTRYRRDVVLALPRIRFLDSTAVTAYERESAACAASPRFVDRIRKLMVEKDENSPESVDHSSATLQFYDPSVAKSKVFGISIMKNGVLGIAMLADKWIVTCGTDGVLKVFDLTSGAWENKCVAILKGHRTRVRSVATFADVRVVSGSDDRTVRVWDLAAQSCLRTLRGHTGAITAVITLGDGRVASASEDSTIRIWDISKSASRDASWTLRGHNGSVLCLTEGHSTTILSGCVDEMIKIWNYRSRLCIMTIFTGQGAIQSISQLADGKCVTGGSNGAVNVWNVPLEQYFTKHAKEEHSRIISMQPALSMHGHRSSITSVVHFNPENIAVSSSDKLLSIWSVVTGKCISVLPGHDDPVTAVVRLLDGRLASCSTDIKLWDTNQPDIQGSRRELTARFNARNERVHSHHKLKRENRSKKLWSGVKSILGIDSEARLHAYSTLTTKYPSTVGMFATNFAPPSSDFSYADSEQAIRKLMSVLFSKGDDMSPFTELKDRMYEWKQRLLRKKGPNMVDWFGISRGKRIREALERLSVLIEECGEKRVTYHRLKETLIEEFGEDLFDQMKEQVTMELAMRDFMLAGGGGMAEARNYPSVPNTPMSSSKSPKYFPEIRSPNSATVEKGAVDAPYTENGDYHDYSISPSRDYRNMDYDDYLPLDEGMMISVNTSLLEYFNEIAEAQSESDRILNLQFDDLTTDLETGKTAPVAVYEADDGTDWIAAALEQSTLWREELNREEPESKEEVVEEAVEEEIDAFNIADFQFRNAVWT